MNQGSVHEALNFAGLVDNRDPASPRLMSLFPLPQPPQGKPYKNFCEKGGRFGPHNVNQEIHLPDVEKPGNLIYLTYFNAGLRAVDVADPLRPKEIGCFVPELPDDQQAIQSNDIGADDDGRLYLIDRWGQGMHILEYTG